MKINPYILNGININNNNNNTSKIKNKPDNNFKTKETVENKKRDKILKIKEAIENGTYKIDIEETSKEMVKHLLK